MKNYEPVMSFTREAAAAYDREQSFSGTPSRVDRDATIERHSGARRHQSEHEQHEQASSNSTHQ